MPQLGETKRAYEIGKGGFDNFVWAACTCCEYERWARLRKGLVKSSLCRSCSARIKATGRFGARNAKWKGGRKYSQGYILVRVYPADFFYSMAPVSGYVLEHRLIMAKHLKRCLLPWEVVHHKNGVKTDNRLENLVLLPTSRQHLPSVRMREVIKKLEKQVEEQGKRITLLEAENVVLREPLEERERRGS